MRPLHFILLLILLPFSIQARAPDTRQSYEGKAAHIEQCRLQLQLHNTLQPVEIQPDSFLGYNPESRVFVAVLCQPNAMRTFQPPAELVPFSKGSTIEVEVATIQGNGIVVQKFYAMMYSRNNHPLPLLTSANLFFATRDLNYFIAAYPDPAIQKKANTDSKRSDAMLQAMLRLTLQSVLLEEGSRPAITEKQYRTRLLAASALMAFLLAAAGGTFFFMRRRRTPE